MHLKLLKMWYFSASRLRKYSQGTESVQNIADTKAYRTEQIGEYVADGAESVIFYYSI